MNKDNFIKKLTDIVASNNIYTTSRKMKYYCKGFRYGSGTAIAVVFPTRLLEQWLVLKQCVEHNKIVIMQAANTGLTGGSTPYGNYDRDVVIINTTKMDKIITLNEGEQIISFPGATLYSLENILQPLNRSPHSVIGSSCIGASIVGGVANNSGGALIKRGPAYSELSLFAQINPNGELILVNHLGIDLGSTPEEIFTNLEAGDFKHPSNSKFKASASDYIKKVRDIKAATPARYNADTNYLYETSGCAGKLAIFAIRLDTFPIAKKEQVFYIGTNDYKQLTNLRRNILSGSNNLPEAAEYMHRDAFDVSKKYGKDTVLLINYLGTSKLPKLFAIKGAVTSWLNSISFLPENIPDHVMQFISQCWGKVIPKRIMEFRDKYEHYLILKMSDEGIDEIDTYLEEIFNDTKKGDYFICTADEAKKAFLLRFAVAGAAIRYEIIHKKEVENVLALDIALPRNELNWVDRLPSEVNNKLVEKFYCGHFMCYVFHQDYFFKKGTDVTLAKEKILKEFSSRGIKYPAEHNVGHSYEAEQGLKDFYTSLDPTNSLNPGIGKTAKNKTS